MITTFNKIWNGMLVILLLVIIGTLVVYFVNKSSKVKLGKEFPKEVTVDKIEDIKGLGYSGQRKIISDKEGNILVAYRKKFNGKSEIFLAKVSPGNVGAEISGTDDPIAVVGSGVDQRVPSVAVDPKSIIHVVWYGSDNGNEPNNRQIKYVNSQDQGKTWSSWRNIAYISGYKSEENFWQEHPMLTSSGNNELYIVWEGRDENNQAQQIKFVKSSNGGNTWTRWKNIQETKNIAQSRPAIVEVGGNLYVFMYSSGTNSKGNRQVQYSVSSDKGENWSAWTTISNLDTDARHLSIATDDLGQVHIVWRSGKENSPTEIIYSRMDKAGNWSHPVAIAPSSQYQFFPSVGTLNDKTLVVVWSETGSSSGFPEEDPEDGTVKAIILKNGRLEFPVTLSNSTGGLYPNLPLFFQESQKMPVLFEEPDGSGGFLVRIKFLMVASTNK